MSRIPLHDHSNIHQGGRLRTSSAIEGGIPGAGGSGASDGGSGSSGSAGAVDSVNGQTGTVVLDAGDIGFTPTGTIAGTDVQTAVAEVATDAAAAVSALSSVYQPLDSDLTAFAGLSIAADKLPYGTGSHTLGLADFTSAGRALVDDADAAAQRTTLGLGTLATQSGTFSGTSSGTNTGDQTLPTRASLGLDTGDSPQFAGVNVGNASDTTITRVSGGVIAVEGATIYAQGGALGTPASGTATNLTGTASGLTAGTVTTNANLTGDVTSVGNATTISAAKATGKWGRTSNAGTVGYQIPGFVITATSTNSPSVNTVYYHACYTPTQVTLDQLAFVVTTGPASNAKVRVGVYAADTNLQPSGAPLGDVEVAVASAFTGTKTATISAVVGPGWFLLAINMDVGMTFRSWTAASMGGFIDSGLASNSGISQLQIAQTYPTSAFPNPGLAWTTSSSGAVAHWIVCRVGTP